MGTVIAAIFDGRYGIKGEAHAQESTVRGYQLGEFQRATGMTGYRQPASLRVQVFLCGAILGRAGHQAVLHLSAGWGGLEKRNPLLDKLLQYEIPTSPKLVLQAHAGG